MAEARFLISSRAFREPRAADRDDGDWGVPVPAPTLWRLVGANNRELGRAAQPYVSARACRLGVLLLRRRLPLLRPVVFSDARGRWLWRLEVEARPVAVAARSYLRRRESDYNLAQFLAAAPHARLPEGTPRDDAARPGPGTAASGAV